MKLFMNHEVRNIRNEAAEKAVNYLAQSTLVRVH